MTVIVEPPDENEPDFGDLKDLALMQARLTWLFTNPVGHPSGGYGVDPELAEFAVNKAYFHIDMMRSYSTLEAVAEVIHGEPSYWIEGNAPPGPNQMYGNDDFQN
jgi:hypothetical protein